MIDIIDPHIHLWDPYTTPRIVSPLVRTFGRFPWVLDKALRMLMPKSTIDFVGNPDHVTRPHMPQTYHRDTGKYNVSGYVHIQAGWTGKVPTDAADETRWLDGLSDPPLAIVGEAHLHDLANLDAVLDAHQSASSRFQGVRDMMARHDSRGVMDFNETGEVLRRDDFKQGYARLGERNLTFDAWVYSHQLPDLIRLVSDVPNTKVVLDHIATPIALGGPHGGLGTTADQRKSIQEQWYDDLARLAQVDHVQLKLSGLLMPVLGFGFHRRDDPPTLSEVVDAMAPHIEFALSEFGVDRCMFASNFPMDKVSTSFETLYDAYFQIVENYTDTEKQKLFSSNALAFYNC
jgi:L-fuconolactonase